MPAKACINNKIRDDVRSIRGGTKGPSPQPPPRVLLGIAQSTYHQLEFVLTEVITLSAPPHPTWASLSLSFTEWGGALFCEVSCQEARGGWGGGAGERVEAVSIYSEVVQESLSGCFVFVLFFHPSSPTLSKTAECVLPPLQSVGQPPRSL